MAFKNQLFVDNGVNVSILSGDVLSTYSELPKGTYKVQFAEMLGFFLEHTEEVRPAISKIYGSTIKNAEHIIEYHNKVKSNTGVLLSGQKGLGKSLMSKYIAEKCSELNMPVVYVTNYNYGITDFLSNLKNCVIILDEFEKTFLEEKDEPKYCRQNELLTLFDGTSGNEQHNIFVVITNSVDDISPFLLGRPGRIRYHYKFSGLTIEEIEQYCEDNITGHWQTKKDFIQKLVKYVVRSPMFSYDMLSSIINEYNIFGSSLKDILSSMNITSNELQKLRADFKIRLKESSWEDEGVHSEEEAIVVGNTTFSADLSIEEERCAYLDCSLGDCKVALNTDDIETSVVGYETIYNIPLNKIRICYGNFDILDFKISRLTG